MEEAAGGRRRGTGWHQTGWSIQVVTPLFPHNHCCCRALQTPTLLLVRTLNLGVRKDSIRRLAVDGS